MESDYRGHDEGFRILADEGSLVGHIVNIVFPEVYYGSHVEEYIGRSSSYEVIPPDAVMLVVRVDPGPGHLYLLGDVMGEPCLFEVVKSEGYDEPMNAFRIIS